MQDAERLQTRNTHKMQDVVWIHYYCSNQQAENEIVQWVCG